MTSEERLDRLERIAMLFMRAGLRERRSRRELEEKINIIINAQIANEERFARNEERFAETQKLTDQRFAELADSQKLTDRRFAELADSQKLTDQRFAELADSQKQTDLRLATLIEIVAKNQNGHTH
jgi:hypothetical protein